MKTANILAITSICLMAFVTVMAVIVFAAGENKKDKVVWPSRAPSIGALTGEVIDYGGTLRNVGAVMALFSMVACVIAALAAFAVKTKSGKKACAVSGIVSSVIVMIVTSAGIGKVNTLKEWINLSAYFGGDFPNSSELVSKTEAPLALALIATLAAIVIISLQLCKISTEDKAPEKNNNVLYVMQQQPQMVMQQQPLV